MSEIERDRETESYVLRSILTHCRERERERGIERDSHIYKSKHIDNFFIVIMIMKSIRRERCSFDLEENRRFVSDRDCVLSCCCSPRQKRSLGVICVSMIVFFNVCGGPWGAEQVMSAGGPLIGLIGIFVFAFLLAIPSILMTTELCTMFPTNGGYSIWVKEAFGPFWGFQESWWSWGSGVVDNAIYPVLFFDVLSQLFEGLNNLNSVQQYFIKVLIMMIFALPNFLFVDIVGRWMLVLFVFSMAPFVVFVGAGLFHSESAHNLIETKSSFSDIDFSTLLSVLYVRLSLSLSFLSTFNSISNTLLNTKSIVELFRF